MKLNSYYLKWMSTYKNDADRRLELLRRCYDRLHSEFDEVKDDGVYDVELCDLLTEIEEELGDD